MTTDFEEMKAVLESKREEVLRRMRRLDDIPVERAPDPVDEIELVMERESVITLLERDTELLREMTSRSGGLQMATSAHIASCGRYISFRRLRAVPWATHCVACQDEADQSRTRKHLRYSWPSH